jgi:asparagine synthase (glutamine-hydrolysing)
MAGKWLLKAAFDKLLPPAICARGKQGFGVPVGQWLKGELREWARERLLDNACLTSWFRPAAIQRLMEEHNDRQINSGKRLWALLVFSIWSGRLLSRS